MGGSWERMSFEATIDGSSLVAIVLKLRTDLAASGNAEVDVDGLSKEATSSSCRALEVGRTGDLRTRGAATTILLD